jgi:hypothetical protein
VFRKPFIVISCTNQEEKIKYMWEDSVEKLSDVAWRQFAVNV